MVGGVTVIFLDGIISIIGGAGSFVVCGFLPLFQSDFLAISFPIIIWRTESTWLSSFAISIILDEMHLTVTTSIIFIETVGTVPVVNSFEEGVTGHSSVNILAIGQYQPSVVVVDTFAAFDEISLTFVCVIF
jgi:hypothetical protein